MKAYIRKTLLKVAFAAFFLLLLFHPIHGVYEKSIFQNQLISKASIGFPARLKIPSINVDAAVESMGLTSAGAMDVPGNTIDVGWYKLGPVPGETGSAVISGHFDGIKGESGVFNDLDKLKKGDKMYVINNLGVTATFVVRESRVFSPGYAEEVFLSNDSGRHLNLITCDGTWDDAKKSYTKRLVVFADIP